LFSKRLSLSELLSLDVSEKDSIGGDCGFSCGSLLRNKM
jgi:hypothetical protein